MAAKTGPAVAVATVAMAVADNNRNCEGRQQSSECSSGSGGDSGCGSSNRGSAAAMVGKGSCVVEVTMIGAVATVTTVEVNLYPLFPLAIMRDNRERR